MEKGWKQREEKRILKRGERGVRNEEEEEQKKGIKRNDSKNWTQT